MRLFFTDIKRVFSGKGTVALCVLAPVVVMLLFASVVAPVFFAAQLTKFNIAICDEDKSKPVRDFVNQLVNSQALKDVIAVYPAESEEQGRQMIENGDVYVFVYIPKNLFKDMRAQKPVSVDITATKAHQLESSLISMALNNSLSLVSRSENLLESAGAFVAEKGATQEQVSQFVSESTDLAISEYMNRRLILGREGTVSPIGEYVPTEYYLGAIFTLFAALAMIPLVRFTASDLSGAIVKRGLLNGRGFLQFFFARLFSGFLFIVLVLTMIFPTGILLKMLSVAIHSVFASSFGALVSSALLSALCFSACAAALASWIGNEDAALWTAFYLVLAMAMASGALVPEGVLPTWTTDVGKWLPLRASMRAMTSALFVFNGDQFVQDMTKLGCWTAAFCALGLWGFGRKGRSA